MSFLLLTPMAPESLRYLPDLADAVARETALLSQKRSIMGWRWRIQIDAEDYALADETLTRVPLLGSLPTSVAVTGRWLGSGATRTIGWVDAGERFDLTVTIDADDVFLPCGLDALLAPFADGNVVWVAGGNTWLDDDTGNTLETFRPGEGLAGFVEPGEVRVAWQRTQTFPFAAATAAYRSSALWEVGGWPGTPTGQDAALLLAVSDLHGGWAVREPVFAYRKHPGQTTNTPEHQRLREVTNRIMARRLP